MVLKPYFHLKEGYGIGDDRYSIAFDGCRQLIWFEAESHPISCTKWKPGKTILAIFYISRLVVELMVLTSSSSLYTDDVLGMLLNIEENKVAFYLNGEAIERDFPAKNR